MQRQNCPPCLHVQKSGLERGFHATSRFGGCKTCSQFASATESKRQLCCRKVHFDAAKLPSSLVAAAKIKLSLQIKVYHCSCKSPIVSTTASELAYPHHVSATVAYAKAPIQAPLPFLCTNGKRSSAVGSNPSSAVGSNFRGYQPWHRCRLVIDT